MIEDFVIEATFNKYDERLIKITLDEYELANLIGLMKRSSAHHNGDWFGQVVYKFKKAMNLLGLKEIRNNFGDILTVENVAEIN